MPEKISEILKQSKIEYEKNGTKICLEFLGGVGNVEKGVSLTGSATLLTIELENGKKYKGLIDFGMFQGCEKAPKYNEILPFDLKEIEFVLVSHTHIDHIGKLLHFSKDEFNGTIWTTKLNKNILYKMLLDTIELQDIKPDKIEILKKKINNYTSLLYDIKKYGEDSIYQIEDIIENLTIKLNLLENKEKSPKKYFEKKDLNKLFSKINSIDYYEKSEIKNGIQLSFINAGHLPGSAQIILKIETNKNETINIGFSGDLGKILEYGIYGPVDISKEKLDIFIIESTYAGEFHPSFLEEEKKLIEIINEAIKNSGKIIIPLFMQGRAQEVVVYLDKLIKTGKISNIPVFYDGKNIKEFLETYSYSKEYKDIFKVFLNNNFLKRGTTGKGKNKQLIFEKYKDPAILLTTGGMMDGGTIRKYLGFLEDSKNLFISMGYQAENTLGRRIFIDGEKQIEIPGIGKIDINANLHNFRGFSGHADEKDLLYLLSQMKFKEDAKIVINHGEHSLAQTEFGLAIKDTLKKVKVLIADFNEEKYNFK